MPESLTRKNDLIIWLYMSETQQKIYSDFLGLERIKEVYFFSYVSSLFEAHFVKTDINTKFVLRFEGNKTNCLPCGQSLFNGFQKFNLQNNSF